MNKFLKRMFWEKGDYYRKSERPLVSPLMNNWDVQADFEYHAQQMQTKYNLRLIFNAECWINDNQENNLMVKKDCQDAVIKRLHHEIFGDIESYLHELRLHLHNNDCESSKKVIDLIQATIKGVD